MLRHFTGIQYGQFKDLDVSVDADTYEVLVSVPTIEKLLGYPEDGRKKLAAKSLKVFAGKDYTPAKLHETLDCLGRKNRIKLVPYHMFLQVVYWEAFDGKGEPQQRAQKLLKAGFADSFSSLVLEQCGIKLTQAERQNVVSFYLTSYHDFYDWIRDSYFAIHGVKPGQDYYREVTVAINLHLFGRKHFQCDRLGNADNKELRKLENFQMYFMDNFRRKGLDSLEPLTALKRFMAA